MRFRVVSWIVFAFSLTASKFLCAYCQGDGVELAPGAIQLQIQHVVPRDDADDPSILFHQHRRT